METRIRAAVRCCIADEIQRLIDMLDEYDGDPDFEIPNRVANGPSQRPARAKI